MSHHHLPHGIRLSPLTSPDDGGGSAGQRRDHPDRGEVDLSPSPRLITGGRRASVQLRQRDTDNAPAMDVANKAVTEALGLAFGVVRLAMIAMLVIFLLSGFQTVKENERGIRLLFGKIVAKDLPSGFVGSAPYPFGELIKVSTSTATLELNEDFWPFVREDDPARGSDLEQLPPSGSLTPGSDGSLITGDQALAHTRATVTYSRDRIADNAQFIYPQAEEHIVRAAVRRAIVLVAAETPVDELVKPSGEAEMDSIASRVQRYAQEQLDTIKSGIRISRLSLRQATVPIAVRSEFASVQNASTKAAQELVQAEAAREQALSEVAGDAARLIMERIARFEEAIALQDAQAQRQILSQINSLMLGEPVVIDGTPVADMVAGDVSQIMSQARQYRANRAIEMRAQADRFAVKLAQYRANPSVTIQAEWADAYRTFVDRDQVQVTYMPGTTEFIELLMTENPMISKLQRQLEEQMMNDKAFRERDRMQRDMRFQTETRLLMEG